MVQDLGGSPLASLSHVIWAVEFTEAAGEWGPGNGGLLLMSLRLSEEESRQRQLASLSHVTWPLDIGRPPYSRPPKNSGLLSTTSRPLFKESGIVSTRLTFPRDTPVMHEAAALEKTPLEVAGKMACCFRP